jgi:hypothetical protein
MRKAIEDIHRHLVGIPDSIGVEVGAGYGENAKEITSLLRFKKFYLVENGAWSNGAVDALKKGFGSKDPFEVVDKASVEASSGFSENYFDLIYIDASHIYEDVRDDISCWYPKLRSGGWMLFHDYDNGVKRAVDELVNSRGLSIITYLNQAQAEAAVRKP